MIRVLLLLSMLFTPALYGAQSVGLPNDFDPDPAIPAPADFLGFEVGQFHPRHDQIVAYLRAVAEASDRVQIEILGQTHGRRPLMLLTFSSPERRSTLSEIRADRVRASRAGDGPVVLWMGYSVHGNEASGASAALMVAWYLAADRSARTKAWLEDTVVLMEPVLNPDGLDRFARWVNDHRGRHPSSDSNDREHREVWPNGRTNYYWFDLNRDWLPLVHPESQARAKALQAWQPHVVTDHHEMGTNSTFFFQPGVPERTNPLTPEENQTLTARFAAYHARALDAAGESYYSRETFDDYYLGKGSTYPDMTGGVGILFEQASARGHVQENDYGQLTFEAAVANQVRTSISSLEGTHALAADLLDYQKTFFEGARELASSAGHAGWLLGDDGDPVRAKRLVALLLAHGIEVYPVGERVSINDQTFEPGSVWAVPSDQDHYRFLTSIFDPVDNLPMETFYDVSAWPLAQAYDLPLDTVNRLPSMRPVLESITEVSHTAATEQSDLDNDAIAWLVAWDQYNAPALLARLLAEGYRVQASADVLKTRTDQGKVELPRGSLVIAPGLQDKNLPAVSERLQQLSLEHQVTVLEASSGLSLTGPDLGSPSAPVVQAPKVAMVTGQVVSANHAGYIWHWFDVRLAQPLTQLDYRQIERVDLNEYTHLILPNGRYSGWSESEQQALVDFVRSGGVLIAARNASVWVESLDFEFDFAETGLDSDPDSGSRSDDDTDSGNDQDAGKQSSQRRAYADFRQDFARTLIGGSALRVELDVTHPLAWGYQRSELVVFRRGPHVLGASDNPYVHVGRYAENPLASGYLSDPMRTKLSDAPALVATRHGRGAVIRMADDYLFRGYWIGAERLFANALFFANFINRTELPTDSLNDPLGD